MSAPLQATTVARQAGRVERRGLSVHDLWPPLLTFALVIGLWELAVWFFQILLLEDLAAIGVDQFNIYLMSGDEEGCLEQYARLIPEFCA